MKKTFILIIMVSLLNATNLTKIEEKPKLQKITETPTGKITKLDEVHKIKLHSYKKIKYNKELLNYSLFKDHKKIYKEIMQENSINKFLLKKIFGTNHSNISILLSGLGYDWLFKRPDLAENFYKLLEKNPKIGLKYKLYVADWFIRTGRPEKVEEYVKKTECMSSFKFGPKCSYYRGLAEYLITGDNKNPDLRVARNYLKEAQDIYYGKN